MPEYEMILGILSTEFAEPSKEGVEFTVQALRYISERADGDITMALDAARLARDLAGRSQVPVVNIAYLKSEQFLDELVQFYRAINHTRKDDGKT